MIRLELLGAHTHIRTPLCGFCPHGRAGCCESPPAVAWADVGRITSLGGRAFLLEQIAAGNLRPSPRGLSIKRAVAVREEGDVWPARCVYLGTRGCSILPEQRSATCNYYICDAALAEGSGWPGDAHKLARAAREALTTLYGEWDIEIRADIDARYPEGPPWDAPFLDWVGERLERLVRRDRSALQPLSPSRARKLAKTKAG